MERPTSFLLFWQKAQLNPQLITRFFDQPSRDGRRGRTGQSAARTAPRPGGAIALTPAVNREDPVMERTLKPRPVPRTSVPRHN